MHESLIRVSSKIEVSAEEVIFVSDFEFFCVLQMGFGSFYHIFITLRVSKIGCIMFEEML